MLEKQSVFGLAESSKLQLDFKDSLSALFLSSVNGLC